MYGAVLSSQFPEAWRQVGVRRPADLQQKELVLSLGVRKHVSFHFNSYLNVYESLLSFRKEYSMLGKIDFLLTGYLVIME